MKKSVLTIAALCMLFIQGEAEDKPAQNVQLITPTLWVKAPDMFACNLTNVDDETHAVEVKIITNGKVLLESKKLIVEPKHTTNHTVQGMPNGAPLYCVFTVEGSKEMYRGAGKIFPVPVNKDFRASDYSAPSDTLVIPAY